MSRLLQSYQYIAPTILTPLSFFLWWQEYQNVPQVLIVWLIPILWAYLVPGIGTNVCKVWEFDVRWKLGRFRPHHGFVFGSATSAIVWLLHGRGAQTMVDVARFTLITCSVLGFWNLLYEIKALKSGLLKVYNQPWANGQTEEAIAMDYSPWFFGGFGAAYGLSTSLFEYITFHWGSVSMLGVTGYFVAAFSLSVALPVLGFIQYSQRTHGHSGTRPIQKV